MSAEFDKAENLIANWQKPGVSAEVVAATIQARAILALAREQRTANLIAVQHFESAKGNHAFEAEIWNDHIRGGLGL